MSFVLRDLPIQVDPRIVAKLARMETATAGHIRQQGFCDRRIQSVMPGKRVAGTAVTLAIPGQDSTLLHHVLGLLPFEPDAHGVTCHRVPSDAEAWGADSTAKPSVRASATKKRPMRPNVTARAEPDRGNRCHQR